MTAPANRPGQGALAYRAGTYGTFFGAMLDRLNGALPALTTRELDDVAIALLDGWAIVADVLAFYQERIANEGFLRTALEKRSLVELANLAGYTPRPGVSASVFLAYTLEKGGDVTLAAGNKAQSIPGPGETAQTFETSDALAARDVWNTIGLRKTRPQEPSGTEPFYISSLTTNLKANDVLLFVRPGAPPAGHTPEHSFVRIAAVEPQAAFNRTKITPVASGPAKVDVASRVARSRTDAPQLASTLLDRIGEVREALILPPSTPPRSPQRLARSNEEILGSDHDVTAQLFGALNPTVARSLYGALAGEAGTAAPQVEVYAFRLHAAPYGHNAPLLPPDPASVANRRTEPLEWPLARADADPTLLSLDARYDRIAAGGFVAIRTFVDATPTTTSAAFADELELFAVRDVGERSRRDYGFPATTTVLRLDAPYFKTSDDFQTLEVLRHVDVFAQSERLQLAEVPLAGDIPEGAAADPTVLELDGLYDGLAPGRYAIVAGTRTDLPGVADAELVMIAATEHRANPNVPGDTLHTFVTLSSRLAFRYARESVKIYGNVVRATHGETRTEALGSGDASLARQRFALKANPLTFVSSPTQSGSQSSLSVRVNGVRWNTTDDPSALGPTDRAYVAVTSDAGTTVTFGDGIHGARLPTGTENAVATYRTGLGAHGNVAAGAIALLQSRPLGVKGVTNPKAASGGADAESLEDLRSNIPTALLALDRLVSVDDYEDLARTFAGVAKATATQLGTGGSGTIIVSLAGPTDAPIDERGELATNLASAFRTLGDPRQAFALRTCERVILLIGASVELAADALWERVEPAIRASLSRTFGFAATAFGKPAYRSAAMAAIANVDGVVDVSIELFAGITNDALASVAELATKPRADEAVVPLPARRVADIFVPAQLVGLDPNVRDTVVLRRNSGGAPV